MNESTADDWVSPCFVAGELRFRVEASRDFAPLVLTVFEGLETTGDDSAEVASFTIRETGADTTSWRLSGPNSPLRSFTEEVRLLDALVAAVNLTALDADPEALHLHAAAASRRGQAALIVGESGSGKTTLVANLAAHGWDYITDEMVRLESDTGAITGFAKPLSIKASSLDLIGWSPPQAMTLQGGTALQVSPIQLGFSLERHARPRLLLCTNAADGRRGVPPVATRIAPADAVVRMMSQTMDASRFGSRETLGVLARLAAECHCYDFAVGDPATMVSMVDELIAAEETSPPAVDVVGGSGNIAADVTTVYIGDRAVIHHHTSGTIVALDAPGCSVWKGLGHANDTDNRINLTGPVESRFVAQLESMGFLKDAPAPAR